MPNQTIKIFIASSSELQDDRNDFRNFIADESTRLNKSGISLDLVRWETEENAISRTRLQDEYNNAIRDCDMIVFLVFSKVGKFTLEEFDTALLAFKENPKLKIWTYFKNAPLYPESIVEEDIKTLFSFKQKLRELGHFRTKYTNIYDLKFQFKNELEKVLPGVVSPATTVAETKDENGTPANTNNTKPVNYVFNELLSRRVLTAIRIYNEEAKRILDSVARTVLDKDTQLAFNARAQQNITSSFVGILGIQLRKLMAIGKEEMSAKKMSEYLKNCHLTAKRALQLLSFTLISKLWDNRKDKNYTLSPEQTTICVNFFEDGFDMDIHYLVNLLQTLVAIFEDNQLDFPITELTQFVPNLQPGTGFLSACARLQEIKGLLDQPDLTETDCLNAEEQLSIFLECLNFMVNYRMVSIKNIGYFEMRNTKPHYLYNFTSLGIDNKSNTNQDKINYAETPTNTDAIMLFKGGNKQNLNLFPFIIDANALAFEGGAKICFYSYNDNGSLSYSFLEDSSIVSITNNQTLKQGGNINDLLRDPQKFKAMRFDDVCNLFEEAKRVITGVGADNYDNSNDSPF